MTAEYRDLLPVIVETTGAVMPDGFNLWGIKTVLPDLTTTHGFRWASPGGTNISNEHLERGNESARPEVPGDGLCVATTWRGMASGGIPARTLLLVAYRSADVVGRDEPAGKLRIGGEVASVALIDGERLIREHGGCADLHGADLSDEDLRGADLRRADLRGAVLQHTYLRGAKLQGADLQGADLWDADLQGADLRGAKLRGAKLRGAKLRGAKLQRAKLQCADLRYADLYGADLHGADLQCADLYGADLSDADLRDADLRRADLQYADLRRTDLRYADLRRAGLQGADLQGAIWPANIAPPDGWTLTISGLLTRDAGSPAGQPEGMKR